MRDMDAVGRGAGHGGRGDHDKARKRQKAGVGGKGGLLGVMRASGCTADTTRRHTDTRSGGAAYGKWADGVRERWGIPSFPPSA